MVFMEMASIYSDTHYTHINVFYGQNINLLNAIAVLYTQWSIRYI
jgi:hypothetical protein